MIKFTNKFTAGYVHFTPDEDVKNNEYQEIKKNILGDFSRYIYSNFYNNRQQSRIIFYQIIIIL